MSLKIKRKKKMIKNIIFAVLSVLLIAEYGHSLPRASNFILFGLFNYVKYKVSTSLP